MLSDDDFDALPGKIQLAYVLGMASQMLGSDLVAQVYRANRPLADDLIGHGPAHGPRPDPAGNWWGGVWRVYDAE
jgi:hypothetical protein